MTLLTTNTSSTTSCSFFSSIECSSGCRISSISITNSSGGADDNNCDLSSATASTTSSLTESQLASKLLLVADNTFKPTNLLSQFPDASSLFEARGECALKLMQLFYLKARSSSKHPNAKHSFPSSSSSSSSSALASTSAAANFLHQVLSYHLRHETPDEENNNKSYSPLVATFQHLLTTYSSPSPSSSSSSSFSEESSAEVIISCCWALIGMIRFKKALHSESITLELLSVACDKLKEVGALLQVSHSADEKSNENNQIDNGFSRFQIKTTREVEICSSSSKTSSGEWWCKFNPIENHEDGNVHVALLSTTDNVEQIVTSSACSASSSSSSPLWFFRGSSKGKKATASIRFEVTRKNVLWRTHGTNKINEALELQAVLVALACDLANLCSKRVLSLRSSTSPSWTRFLTLFFSSEPLQVQQQQQQQRVPGEKVEISSESSPLDVPQLPLQYQMIARRSSPAVAKLAAIISANHNSSSKTNTIQQSASQTINFGLPSSTVIQFCLDRQEKIIAKLKKKSSSPSTVTLLNTGSQQKQKQQQQQQEQEQLQEPQLQVEEQELLDTMQLFVSYYNNSSVPPTLPVIPQSLAFGASSASAASRSQIKSIIEDIFEVFLFSPSATREDRKSAIENFLGEIQSRFDKILRILGSILTALKQIAASTSSSSSSSSSSSISSSSTYQQQIALLSHAANFLDKNRTSLFTYYCHHHAGASKYQELSSTVSGLVDVLTKSTVPAATSGTAASTLAPMSKPLASSLSRLIFKWTTLLRSTPSLLFGAAVEATDTCNKSDRSSNTRSAELLLISSLAESIVDVNLARAKAKLQEEVRSAASSSAPSFIQSQISNSFRMIIDSGLENNKWRAVTTGPLCNSYDRAEHATVSSSNNRNNTNRSDSNTNVNNTNHNSNNDSDDDHHDGKQKTATTHGTKKIVTHHISEMKFLIPNTLLLPISSSSSFSTSSSTIPAPATSSYASYYASLSSSPSPSPYSSYSSHSSPYRKFSIAICPAQEENPARVSDENHSLFIHFDSTNGITAVKGNEKHAYVNRRLIVSNAFQLTPYGMTLTDDVDFKLKFVPQTRASTRTSDGERFYTVIPVLFGVELDYWTPQSSTTTTTTATTTNEQSPFDYNNKNENNQNNNNNNNTANLFSFPESMFPQLRLHLRQTSGSTSRVKVDCIFSSTPTTNNTTSTIGAAASLPWPSSIQFPSGQTPEKCFAALMLQNTVTSPHLSLRLVSAQHQRSLFRSAAEQHLSSCLLKNNNSESDRDISQNHFLDVVSRLSSYLRHNGAALTRSVVLSLLNNKSSSSSSSSSSSTSTVDPSLWPTSAITNILLNIDLVDEISAQKLLDAVCAWYRSERNGNNTFDDDESSEPLKWVDWKTATALTAKAELEQAKGDAATPSKPKAATAAAAPPAAAEAQTKRSISYTVLDRHPHQQQEQQTIIETTEGVPCTSGDFVAVPSQKLLTPDTMRYCVDFVITASTTAATPTTSPSQSTASATTKIACSFGALPHQQIFVGLAPVGAAINVASIRSNDDGSGKSAPRLPLYCLPNDPHMLDSHSIPGFDSTNIRRARSNWASSDLVFQSGDVVTLVVDLWKRTVSAHRNGLPLGVIFSNIGGGQSSAAASATVVAATTTERTSSSLQLLLLTPFFRVNTVAAPSPHQIALGTPPFFPSLRCQAWYRPYSFDQSPAVFSPLFACFVAFLMMRCSFSNKVLQQVCTANPTLLKEVSCSVANLATALTNQQQQQQTTASTSTASKSQQQLLALIRKALSAAHHHLAHQQRHQQQSQSLFPDLFKFFSSVAQRDLLPVALSGLSPSTTASPIQGSANRKKRSPKQGQRGEKSAAVNNLVSSLHLLSILKFLRSSSTTSWSSSSSPPSPTGSSISIPTFTLPVEFITSVLSMCSPNEGTPSASSPGAPSLVVATSAALRLVGDLKKQQQLLDGTSSASCIAQHQQHQQQQQHHHHQLWNYYFSCDKLIHSVNKILPRSLDQQQQRVAAAAEATGRSKAEQQQSEQLSTTPKKINVPLLEQIKSYFASASVASSRLVTLPHHKLEQPSSTSLTFAAIRPLTESQSALSIHNTSGNNNGDTNNTNKQPFRITSLVNHEGLLSGEGYDDDDTFAQHFTISGRFLDAFNIRLLLCYDYDDSASPASTAKRERSDAGNDDDEQQQQAEADADATFSCAACTFINPATATRCEICGTPRAGATRACGVCTYAYNAATDTRCNVCGSSLGGAGRGGRGGGGAGRGRGAAVAAGGIFGHENDDDGQPGGQDDGDAGAASCAAQLKMKCKKCNNKGGGDNVKIEISSTAAGRNTTFFGFPIPGGRGGGRGGGGGGGGGGSPAGGGRGGGAASYGFAYAPVTAPATASANSSPVTIKCKDCGNEDKKEFTFTKPVFGEMRLRFSCAAISTPTPSATRAAAAPPTTANGHNATSIGESPAEFTELKGMIRYPNAFLEPIRLQLVTAAATTSFASSPVSPTSLSSDAHILQSSAVCIVANLEVAERQRTPGRACQPNPPSPVLIRCMANLVLDSILPLVSSTATAASSTAAPQQSSSASNSFGPLSPQAPSATATTAATSHHHHHHHHLQSFVARFTTVELVKLFLSVAHSYGSNVDDGGIYEAVAPSSTATCRNPILLQLAPLLPAQTVITLLRICLAQMFGPTSPSAAPGSPTTSISVIHTILVSLALGCPRQEFLESLRKSVFSFEVNDDEIKDNQGTNKNSNNRTSMSAAEIFLFGLVRHFYCVMIAVPSTYRAGQVNNKFNKSADADEADAAADLMGFAAEGLFGDDTRNHNGELQREQQQQQQRQRREPSESTESNAGDDDTDETDEDYDDDDNGDDYNDEGDDGDEIPDGPLVVVPHHQEENGNIVGLLSSQDVLLYCEAAIAIADLFLLIVAPATASPQRNESADEFPLPRLDTTVLSILASDKRVAESMRIALMLRASSSSSAHVIFRPDSRVAAACYLQRIYRSMTMATAMATMSTSSDSPCSASALFPHELLDGPHLLRHNLATFAPVASSLLSSLSSNMNGSSGFSQDPFGFNNNINGLVHGMVQGATSREARSNSIAATAKSSTTTTKKLYYEVILPHAHRYAQLRAGWGAAAFGRQGIGSQVGSTMSSIAYNLKSLVHALGGDSEYDPPRHTQPGDIIGCLLDTTTQSVSWSLNGLELTPISYGGIDVPSASSNNSRNSNANNSSSNNIRKNKVPRKKVKTNVDEDNDEGDQDGDDDDEVKSNGSNDEDEDEDEDEESRTNFLLPFVSGSAGTNDPLEVRCTDCVFCPFGDGYKEYSNVLISWNCYRDVLLSPASSSQQTQNKVLDYQTYLALNTVTSSLLRDGISFKKLLLPRSPSTGTRKQQKRFAEIEERFCLEASTNQTLLKLWRREIQETKTLLRTVQPYLHHLHSISDLSSVCGNLISSSSSAFSLPTNSSTLTNDPSSSSVTSWMRGIRYLTLPTHRWSNFERLASARLRRGLVATGPDGQSQLPKALIDMKLAEEYYKHHDSASTNPAALAAPPPSHRDSVLEQLMHQVTKVLGERCMLTPVPYSIKWKDCIAEDGGGLLRATYSAISDEIMGRQNTTLAEQEQVEQSQNDDTTATSASAAAAFAAVAAIEEQHEHDEATREEEATSSSSAASASAKTSPTSSPKDADGDAEAPNATATVTTVTTVTTPRRHDRNQASSDAGNDSRATSADQHTPFCRLFVPSSHRSLATVVPAPLASPSKSAAIAATPNESLALTKPWLSAPTSAAYDLECYRFLGTLLGNITLTGTGVLSILFPRMFWMYLLGDDDEKQAITLDHYYFDVNDSVKSVIEDDDMLMDDETYGSLFPDAAEKLNLAKRKRKRKMRRDGSNDDGEDDGDVDGNDQESDSDSDDDGGSRDDRGEYMMMTVMGARSSSAAGAGAGAGSPSSSGGAVVAVGAGTMLGRHQHSYGGESNDAGGSFSNMNSPTSPNTTGSVHHSNFPRVATTNNVAESTSQANLLVNDGAEQHQQHHVMSTSMMTSHEDSSNAKLRQEISRRRKAAEYYLLHQFDRQFEAIRQGFASIVPKEVSRELTWFDLERRCCGVPAADVKPQDTIKWFDVSNLAALAAADADDDMLTEDSTSSSTSSQHSLKRYFEAALLKLTGEQRSQLLVFCTGQKCLPLPEKITVNVGTERYRFPTAHTCSPISLILQPYQSAEELLEKLLGAISHYSDFAFV